MSRSVRTIQHFILIVVVLFFVFVFVFTFFVFFFVVVFQWQGWYFVFRTIRFGRKPTAYLNHTIGMFTGYIRLLGHPCSQKIDDRHLGQLSI